jgi:hypothetical protein
LLSSKFSNPSIFSDLKKLFSTSLLLVSLAGKNRRNFPLSVRCLPTLNKSLKELNRKSGQRNRNPKNRIRYFFTEFLNPEKMR